MADIRTNGHSALTQAVGGACAGIAESRFPVVVRSSNGARELGPAWQNPASDVDGLFGLVSCGAESSGRE